MKTNSCRRKEVITPLYDRSGRGTTIIGSATITTVRRVLLAIIVGLLALSASGASTLILAEPCGGYDLAGDPDGACPPTCVTCGCCAQPAESVPITVQRSREAPVDDVEQLLPPVLKTDPHDILHVPKRRLA
jgi:hypothetical protein